MQPGLFSVAALLSLGVLLAVVSGSAAAAANEPSVSSQPWGSVGGRSVSLFTLKNSNGITAKITNYGAIVTELDIPDKNGATADVVLGFDTLDGYRKGHPFFGTIAGRVANRIAKGQFTLDGKTYQLATNNGPNHLHGGTVGFDKHVWNVVETRQTDKEAAITLRYISPAGEENYPGTLTTTVTYALTNENRLWVEMTATTDAPTIVNLAQHSYFNLAGQGSGDVLAQTMQINADRYTPTDATLIPTGELKSVEAGAYDFRQPKTIGQEIGQLPASGDDPGGYDINYVLNGTAGRMRQVAVASDPVSGRTLTVFTDQPGVQFYTGNFLDGTLTGKSGAVYQKHTGFALETQKFPDAINKEGQPGWASPILRPGETYRHTVIWEFSTK